MPQEIPWLSDTTLPPGDEPGYFVYSSGYRGDASLETQTRIPTYYVDQAGRVGGLGTSICLTPIGVRDQVERPLAARIHALGTSGESPSALEREILDNPHLHAILKQNLLLNLWQIAYGE